MALVRFGRHDGQSPRCVDRDGLPAMIVNRVNHPVVLGDGAVYTVAGDPAGGRVVNFTACLGTYLVWVRYEVVGATDAAAVESATTVAQEVLSWL
ncbi:hypothetical protein ACW0Q9_12885 [Micromonospora sp. I033]